MAQANSFRHDTIDAFCESLRMGLNDLADAMTPPQSARNHFRASKIEFLQGLRELIDHSIHRASASDPLRSSVVQE